VELSAHELRILLEYDQDTGLFQWMACPRRATATGYAGCIDKAGYCVIRIRGKGYKAHRLAWLYTFGEWPKQFIDHINGVRADNRIVNLRDVPLRINSQNKSRHRTGRKAGVTSPCKRHPKWVASIQVNGKEIYLGSFDTEAEAYSSYQKAVNDLQQGKQLTVKKYKTRGYVKEGEKYRANCWKNGKLLWLGVFDTPEEAHQVHLNEKCKKENNKL
jgi:hypothetical protein